MKTKHSFRQDKEIKIKAISIKEYAQQVKLALGKPLTPILFKPSLSFPLIVMFKKEMIEQAQ